MDQKADQKTKKEVVDLEKIGQEQQQQRPETTKVDEQLKKQDAE